MKAIALYSGGLDSVLAAKLVKDQGMDVIALKFVNPFSCERDFSESSAKSIGVKLVKLPLDDGYVRMVRNPKHGYGSGINPCIDCKIFMFRKAWEYAKRTGAKFLVTGEVLGERPMSQNMRALRLIEREAGVEGFLLRPLTARLLPETEPEKRGWVDRNRLLGIHGRSRKTQLSLAKKFRIRDYPTPAGGCLLTQKEYARKLRDLFSNQKSVSENDIKLLGCGRQFRFGKCRIVVGRREEDNKAIVSLAGEKDVLFYVPGYGSPVTLLRGGRNRKAVGFAASLTAAYSDHPGKAVTVKYGRHGSLKRMHAEPAKKSESKKYMIC